MLGTAGAVMVLLGAFGLRMLPFNWAGIILLLAGIAVMAADLLVGGMGILSLFGLAALVTGGLVLFRAPGGELLNVSLSLVSGMSLALGFLFLAAVFLVVRSMRRKTTSGKEGMEGAPIEVIEDLSPIGLVKCRGEIWRARTASGAVLGRGARGSVSSMDGMTLVVLADEGGREPADPEEKKGEKE